MANTVFVYGSLKQGFGNHVLLKDSKFLGEDSVRGYTMYSLGGFPAICPNDDGGVVHGEVYQVDDETFSRLDILEGYPHFYNRKPVFTEKNGDYCWVYFHEEPPNNNVVEGGEW